LLIKSLTFMRSTSLCQLLKIALGLVLLASCKKENNISEDVAKTQKLQAIADSMRLEVNKLVGLPIPGMHFYLEGPKGSFFISTADDDTKKLTANHWFRMASITKHFTSVAILNMQEDGWLNIDDTITSFIPGTNLPYVPNTPSWDIPHKEKITIKQLMSHTAGVFDSDNEEIPALGQTFTNYKLNINPNYAFTTEDFTSFNASNNLSYFEPGTGYHYSNVGYSMLATIISRVYSIKQQVDRSYADYMHNVVVAGVPNIKGLIRFPDLASENKIPSPGTDGMIYTVKKDTIRITSFNPSLLIGQGNGQATIKAVHDWFRANMKGNGVLKLNTLQLISTPFVPDFSGSEYTFGTQIIGNLGIGHAGDRVGNSCFIAYDKATDISILGYIPFWDLTDGQNSLVNNCILPLYYTMEYMSKELLN